MIIYYVGLKLSKDSERSILETYGIDNKLHVTLIYSRAWFPWKPKIIPGLIMDPPFEIDYFGELTVLRIPSQILTKRHNELKDLGATWDHGDFKPHITLGKFKRANSFSSQILFGEEYYRTWDDANN